MGLLNKFSCITRQLIYLHFYYAKIKTIDREILLKEENFTKNFTDMKIIHNCVLQKNISERPFFCFCSVGVDLRCCGYSIRFIN